MHRTSLQQLMGASLHLGATAVALALAGCPPPSSNGDASTLDGSIPSFACNASPCAIEAGVPFQTGDGGFACVPVGASQTDPTSPWPDAAQTPLPRSYIRPGAPPGGDGSLNAPVATLAQALALQPAPVTLVLAPGEYALSQPLELGSSTLFVLGSGAGPQGSRLRLGPNTQGLSVQSASGRLTLRALSITGDRATTNVSCVSAESGALLDLRDIVFDGCDEGIRLVDARANGDGLTLTRSGRRGISLLTAADGNTGSTATFHSVRVTDGAGAGILVDRSQLTLDAAYLFNNQRDGLAFLGGSGRYVSSARNVTSLCNGVVGISLARGGVAVTGARWFVGGTQVPAGTVGGDGVFVGGGATLQLDTEGPRPMTDADMGTRSRITGNVRTGVLYSGRIPGSDAGVGGLEILGATIENNQGPGVFVQEGAVSNELSFLAVRRNGAVGVAVTSQAEIHGLICDGMYDTQAATLRTTTGDLNIEGDGLSIGDGAHVGTLADNEFSNNRRFGVVFSGGAVDQFTLNRGSGNEFGVGRYLSTITTETSNTISGRSTSPTTPPVTARGGLTSP